MQDNTVFYPDTRLSEISSDIVMFNEKYLYNLMNKLYESIDKNNLVGIAAPQIGIKKNVVVVKNNDDLVLFVNPKIIFSSNETISSFEGCLSLPGMYTTVDRNKTVYITYNDIQGKKMNMIAHGKLSCIIQHEIDHLNGILIIDKSNKILNLKAK